MADPVTINLRHVARGLSIPLRQVEATVELLDEGNTVPFVTRYRKDQTGGLDEEQVRQIQARLAKMRLLAERKQTILRSIEAQGKLTEKLGKQIHAAGTTKRLEDLYLPFKPKKQTLATLARTRGLELLATEILTAAPGCVDLDARAADFVNPDRQVPSPADALLGAGHILAEQFSEGAELRQELREVLQRTGKLISAQFGAELKPPPEKTAKAEPPSEKPPESSAPTVPPVDAHEPAAEQAAAEPAPSPALPDDQIVPVEPPPVEVAAPAEPVAQEPAPEPVADTPAVQDAAAAAEPTSEPESHPPTEELPSPVAEQPAEQGVAAAVPADTEPSVPAGPPGDPEVIAAVESQVVRAVEPPRAEEPAQAPAEVPQTAPPPEAAAVRPPKPAPKQAKVSQRLTKKELKKKKAEERKHHAFSDYFSYLEEIKKIPPHRVLAINRGERARVLRVKIECDMQAMYQVLDELCVPPGHPHADFLRGCARDALTRLILPSLEREVRRELTERAETHAVGVFARNLRNLLLQPPVRDRRVLAVDPGYKSGCKLVALDQFGNMLAHGMVYLIGKPERRQEAKQTVIDVINAFQLSVVTIGNGTGSRETEDFIAELISNELKDRGICYVIVNEAGASVYSTSRIGREELPSCDASLRGAISIGRRLQDPLSELVKIDPANIGVGLYQHDVKAKHLRTSLDDVVESCVNYVGVDVNTASPGLLRYVSGLNQLTARRLYEHRLQHGPFHNREQLKEVPGFGEATFVQAAGFLKIGGGDNPLDATWIHPESYEIANRVMARMNCTPADLAAKEAGQPTAQVDKPDTGALAAELQVGVLLLQDILAQLARPGRDPREDLPAPVFKRGVIKLEDLAPGMELTGTVLNVVDFGAFVDIGMHDSGLVHVSQLADRFVRDPHEVVAVGDIIKVWVVEVDKQRRRVSLTMIRPGTERSGPRRRAETTPPAAGGAAPAQVPSQAERKPRPPQGAPRPRPQGPPRPRPQGPPPRTQAPPPRPPFKPKSRPKPVIPLTEEMKAGKAPMRTFGDLMQFFEINQQAPPPTKPPSDQPQASHDDQEPKTDS